jgi:hypothetical protein
VPQYENYYAGTAIGWQVLAFLILDDMTQYWWHRLSHSSRMMWKLHRPHHVVEEMGVLVTYRNAILYYALMPGIWLSACLIFLGMGYVYLFYLPIKLGVILLAHSETRWDRFLYKYKVLNPVAWVVERVISDAQYAFCSSRADRRGWYLIRGSCPTHHTLGRSASVRVDTNRGGERSDTNHRAHLHLDEKHQHGRRSSYTANSLHSVGEKKIKQCKMN